jgi:hypothetical protein
MSNLSLARSLGAVQVSAGMNLVRIRNHDEVYKYGGIELVVDRKARSTKPWIGNPT